MTTKLENQTHNDLGLAKQLFIGQIRVPRVQDFAIPIDFNDHRIRSSQWHNRFEIKNLTREDC